MKNNDRPSANPHDNATQEYFEACEHRLASLEIDAIARDLDLPAEEIAQFYSLLYAELKARARVTDYLLVLVSRKVRARFQRRRLS